VQGDGGALSGKGGEGEGGGEKKTAWDERRLFLRKTAIESRPLYPRTRGSEGGLLGLAGKQKFRSGKSSQKGVKREKMEKQ